MPFAADETMEYAADHATLQANGRHDPAEIPTPYPGFVLNNNPMAFSDELHKLYEQVLSPREKQNANAADKFENLAQSLEKATVGAASVNEERRGAARIGALSVGVCAGNEPRNSDPRIGAARQVSAP